MTLPTSDDIPDHIPTAGDTTSRLRVIRSEELFQGDQEILIRHGSEVYRLRLTRSGKLILTK